jgi:hypothetical protein
MVQGSATIGRHARRRPFRAHAAVSWRRLAAIWVDSKALCMHSQHQHSRQVRASTLLPSGTACCSCFARAVSPA